MYRSFNALSTLFNPSISTSPDLDWLVACAALVFFSLLAQVLALAVAVWGLSSRRRVPYLVAGGLCCGAGWCFHVLFCLFFSLAVARMKNAIQDMNLLCLIEHPISKVNVLESKILDDNEPK